MSYVRYRSGGYQAPVIHLCKAKEVWRLLGLDVTIDRACVVDHTGENVLEYLVVQPVEECVILDLRNFSGSNCYWFLVFMVREEKVSA